MRFLTTPSLLATFALSSIVACDDGTDPTPEPFDITFTATSEWDSYGSDGRENPVLTCNVILTALATGSSNDEASWQDGVFRVYAGLDRTQPLDSLPVTVAQVRELMRAESISGGEGQTSGVRFTGAIPMEIGGEFRYEVHGAVRAAPFHFDCGPPIITGDVYPLPDIGPIMTSPAVLEPGGHLEVGYEVESTIGLWSTTFILSGAVNDTVHWVEFMRTDVAGTASFEIPASAPLGVPIEVRIVSTDVALQQASRVVATAPLNDVTPPEGELTLGDSCSYHGCQFATGDTMSFTFTGSDNSAMGWLVYQIGDPVLRRDSARIVDRVVWMGSNRVTVSADWLGTHPVRAWVRDGAGNDSPLLVDDTVTFYPSVESVVHESALPAGFEYRGAVADFARARLYVVDGQAPRVVTLSLPTLAIEGEIALPAAGGGIALSADGTTLVVTLPSLHALASLDPTQADPLPITVPITAIATAPEHGLSDVAVTADGEWLAFFEYWWDWDYSESVVAVDPTTGEQRALVGPTELGGLWSAANGAETVVTEPGALTDDAEYSCVRRYDQVTGTFGDCHDALGGFELHAEASEDGSFWATPVGLFDGAWQRIGASVDIAYPDPPTLPDATGTGVYVFVGDRMYRIDLTTSRIALRTSLTHGTPLDLLGSPDGKWLMRVTEGTPPRITLVELP